MRAAMSGVAIPSGWAWRIATSRVSRARRSRLAAVPLPLVVDRSWTRRIDDRVAAALRRRQVDLDGARGGRPATIRAASPLTLPATWPSWPSRKTQ